MSNVAFKDSHEELNFSPFVFGKVHIGFTKEYEWNLLQESKPYS